MKLIQSCYSIKVLCMALGIVFSFSACAQKEKHTAEIIAFYNLENLYDTIKDPAVNDVEFLPDAIKQWTGERYKTKLSNIARVIGDLGKEKVTGGPAIVGLAEIENLGALEDLLNTPPLSEGGYKYVHYDSPDLRGIDVALIYKSDVFQVKNTTSNRLYMPDLTDFYSRDQLVVTGKLDGDLISIIVNHWPSRFSGPEYRAEAAKLTRHLSDSLMKTHKNAKIFIMGDLNDDPTDASVAKVLGANGFEDQIGKGDLFNPMWKMHQDGNGTLAYRGTWNLFDQIIISQAVLNARKGWKFSDAKVFKEDYIIQQDGPYAGYPLRTYGGGTYLGGYSDHFPVYMILTKEK